MTTFLKVVSGGLIGALLMAVLSLLAQAPFKVKVEKETSVEIKIPIKYVNAYIGDTFPSFKYELYEFNYEGCQYLCVNGSNEKVITHKGNCTNKIHSIKGEL